MQSIGFGDGIWGPPGEGGGGSGLDGGGWPTLTAGGAVKAEDAEVKETHPRKDFGAIGSERKLGLVKPHGATYLMLSQGTGGNGGGGHVPERAMADGGAGGTAWEEFLKSSENQEMTLEKSQSSAKGGGSSRANSGFTGGFRRFNRDHGKENSPPDFGDNGMKVKKVPLGQGQVLGCSSIMNFGPGLGLKGATHVHGGGGFKPGGGGMGGPVMFQQQVPYGGRAPLFNESRGFSSLAGANWDERSYLPQPKPNDAWFSGFLAGQQSMAARPPVQSMHPPMLPGERSRSPLNFNQSDRSSGFRSCFGGSGNTPAVSLQSRPSPENFGNYGPVVPFQPIQADGLPPGTGFDAPSKRTYSTSSLSDGYDHLPESGYNSWNASCATSPEAGVSVPSSAGGDNPKKRESTCYRVNKGDVAEFVKDYGYGGEERHVVQMNSRKKYFKAFQSLIP